MTKKEFIVMLKIIYLTMLFKSNVGTFGTAALIKIIFEMSN